MGSFNRVPRMFRLPSHRVFDYKPRFYDIEREKFDQLRKRKEAETIASEEKQDHSSIDHHQNIRAAFSRSRDHKIIHTEGKGYALRVLLIVLVLAALFYLFFFI